MLCDMTEMCMTVKYDRLEAEALFVAEAEEEAADWGR